MPRTPLHIAFGVLAAILTAVAVFAVKRGTEWALGGLPTPVLVSMAFGVMALALAAVLYDRSRRRSRVDGRKQR